MPDQAPIFFHPGGDPGVKKALDHGSGSATLHLGVPRARLHSTLDLTMLRMGRLNCGGLNVLIVFLTRQAKLSGRFRGGKNPAAEEKFARSLTFLREFKSSLKQNKKLKLLNLIYVGTFSTISVKKFSHLALILLDFFRVMRPNFRSLDITVYRRTDSQHEQLISIDIRRQKFSFHPKTLFNHVVNATKLNPASLRLFCRLALTLTILIKYIIQSLILRAMFEVVLTFLDCAPPPQTCVHCRKNLRGIQMK
jgi:hypothetical protein